jgi:Family of unknown function (DUF6090)
METEKTGSSTEASVKAGKYFKYAIGEIILVMIGILLAIQVNNWNEKRLNKSIENKYLTGILNDLNVDILAYKDAIKNDSIVIITVNSILKSYTNNQTINSDSLLKISKPLWLIYSVKAQTNTYEEMKASGNVVIINSKELRHKINSYYKYFNEIIGVEKTNNDITINTTIGFIIEDADYNSIMQIIDLPLKTPEVSAFEGAIFNKNSPKAKRFQNIISLRSLTSQNTMNRYRQGLQRSLQLKETIENSLNN